MKKIMYLVIGILVSMGIFALISWLGASYLLYEKHTISETAGFSEYLSTEASGISAIVGAVIGAILFCLVIIAKKIIKIIIVGFILFVIISFFIGVSV